MKFRHDFTDPKLDYFSVQDYTNYASLKVFCIFRCEIVYL